MLAALLAGAPLIATYTRAFMPALGSFVLTYFPLFLLGAVSGKLMNDSGSASSIGGWIVDRVGAQRAILATVLACAVLACAVLTYGGVTAFVVVSAVLPIGVQLFRETDIPKRLMPGAIALGGFTFTMTALSGSPAVQNAIPAPCFGTNAFRPRPGPDGRRDHGHRWHGPAVAAVPPCRPGRRGLRHADHHPSGPQGTPSRAESEGSVTRDRHPAGQR